MMKIEICSKITRMEDAPFLIFYPRPNPEFINLHTIDILGLITLY